MGETTSLTGEFVGETHRVLELTQNHPPRNQHQKGPIYLCVAREVTESQQRVEQAALFPLRPLSHIQLRQKKYMAQMKEQIKAPEKIQLRDKEIANQSDAQFKTLVIRKLTDMVEYGCEIEEKVKAMKSEIKENV